MDIFIILLLLQCIYKVNEGSYYSLLRFLADFRMLRCMLIGKALPCYQIKYAEFINFITGFLLMILQTYINQSQTML